MKLNTPNKLTIARMIITPIYLAVILWEGLPHRFLIATLIFSVAAITAAIDGKLARKNGEITNFGKLLDPIADKMLVTAGLLAFLKEGLCNIWIVFVIIIREFVMTSLRLIASSQGKVIPANIFGKIKTVMQMVSFIVVMLLCHVDDYFGWPISLMPADISNILMGLSAVMGVVSAVIYYVQSKDVIDFNK